MSSCIWQLHTMTRPKEAARARCCDIDILTIMQPISKGHEFLFPDTRDLNTHTSVFTANAAIKRSLNFKGELVAHGLRAIASTTLHESGFDSLHIEACLSHSDQNETRASYNRTDFFENRKAIMNWWSDRVKNFCV